MKIHVIRPGNTLYRLAMAYKVPLARLLEDNQLPDPNRLVVGQAIVIRYPKTTCTVRPGDTLDSIAQASGLSVRALLRNNPGSSFHEGQTLVLTYEDEPTQPLSVLGYAYPWIDPALLARTLPFVTELSPFTYRFDTQGNLIPLEDSGLRQAAAGFGTSTLFHLSNLGNEGEGFDRELAHGLFADPAAQQKLFAQVAQTAQEGGYQGVDIDFENLYPADAPAYARFVEDLRNAVEPLPVLVALAPKASEAEASSFAQGHDYHLLGRAADYVLLMAYDWGNSASPPMAVAPLNQVRRVLQYALKISRRRKFIWASPTTATTGRFPISRAGPPGPCPTRRRWPWRRSGTRPSASTRRRRRPGSAIWTFRARSMRCGLRTPAACAGKSSWPWSMGFTG